MMATQKKARKSIRRPKQPKALAWDPAILRSYVSAVSLVPTGMTASEYLERNRKAAGFVD